MQMWLFVWLVATVLTIVILVVFLASIASSIVQLGRAASRFQQEVGGLASDISRSAARVEEHAGRLTRPGHSARR